MLNKNFLDYENFIALLACPFLYNFLALSLYNFLQQYGVFIYQFDYSICITVQTTKSLFWLFRDLVVKKLAELGIKWLWCWSIKKNVNDNPGWQAGLGAFNKCTGASPPFPIFPQSTWTPFICVDSLLSPISLLWLLGVLSLYLSCVFTLHVTILS